MNDWVFESIYVSCACSWALLLLFLHLVLFQSEFKVLIYLILLYCYILEVCSFLMSDKKKSILMGGEEKELGGIEKTDHNQAMLCEEKLFHKIFYYFLN